VEWGAKEGWNPSQTDAIAFYAADPEGFFVVEYRDQPAGCIFAVRYGPNFGTIGLLIAVPEFRHTEVGFLLVRKALHVLHGRIIGVDGVLDKVGHYQKLGFHVAHHDFRYQVDHPKANPECSHAGITLVDATTIPFDDLREYDQRFLPESRGAEFLKSWITLPIQTLVALDPTSGKIIGYGSLHPCYAGSKIAPLFANDETTAEVLLNALTALAPEGPMSMDIPGPNEAAQRLAQKNGMEVVLEIARMYNGPAPDLPLDNIFGIILL
jgi:hypothetical protein